MKEQVITKMEDGTYRIRVGDVDIYTNEEGVKMFNDCLKEDALSSYEFILFDVS